VNPEDDPRYRDYVATYVEAAGRKGITPDAAKTLVRTNTTVIGALAVRRGDADALICGLEGRFQSRLKNISDIIGCAGRARDGGLVPRDHVEGRLLPGRHPRAVPIRAPSDRGHDDRLRDHVRRFGIAPKIALISTRFRIGGQPESACRCAMRCPHPAGRPSSRSTRDAGRHGPVWIIRERVFPSSTSRRGQRAQLRTWTPPTSRSSSPRSSPRAPRRPILIGPPSPPTC
jgi:malate dehydrogenase (oxaloacetate-decarboxylating)(NADP+)